MVQLALTLLGGFAVTLDGVPVAEFDSNKVRALLAYLAVESERAHRRESLAALLWPGYPDRSARTNLRNALSNLRTAIGDREADPPFLWITRDTLQFNAESDHWLDVAVVAQAQAEADSLSTPDLMAASDAYAGDFLAGFTLEDAVEFDDWATTTRERLRRQALELLGVVVDRLVAEGDTDCALTYARHRVELEPWLEAAQQQLIRLLAEAGRRSAALRQYRDCVRVLEEELGAEPSAETVALYEEIRAGKGSEDAVVSSGRPKAATTRERRLPAFLVAGAEPTVREQPVFVGRGPELARLDGYLEAALAGRGQVAFVVGGAGRGKTALLRAFAEEAMTAHPDLLVVSGTCNAYAGSGDAYLPLREAFEMLTGDVAGRWSAGLVTGNQARRLWSALAPVLAALVASGPHVIDVLVPGRSLLARAAAAGQDEAPWLSELKALSERSGGSALAQRALFQQVTNVLRAVAMTHPLLFVLDDLQWADPGTCGLLLYLGRQLAGSRILVVGAYRPEEVPMAGDAGGRAAAHPLTKVLYELQRLYGGVWVDLREADAARGAQFVKALIATESNRLGEGFSAALHAQTGGHPLFTVELLRTLRERGDLRRAQDGAWVGVGPLDWGTLPARVEAVIAERLERLGREARDLVTVASVEGETFTADVVAQVQGLPERETLRVLDELAGHHRLVREADAVMVNGRHLARYSFAHALFQAYAYERIGTATRRLLHGEVAATLEALYGEAGDRIAAQLAQHYDHAEQAERAAAWAIRAGDRARLAYANGEAAGWYQRALDRLASLALDEKGKAQRLRALSGLGKVRYHTGKREQAADLFREAIALGRELDLDPQELVLLYHWLGEALWWLNQHEEQIKVGEEGLALVADEPESVGAALMQQVIAMGASAFGTGDRSRYLSLLDQTESFLPELPYIEELAQAYQHIIERYVGRMDVASALPWIRIFKERAEQAGDLSALAAVENQMGTALAFTGDLVGGIRRQQAYLESAIRIGDTTNELFALEELMKALWSVGDLDAASRYGQRALAARRRLDSPSGLEHVYLGLIALSAGDLPTALCEFGDAERCEPDNYLIGYLQSRVYLASGDRTRARTLLGDALVREGKADHVFSDWAPWVFCQMLNGLEETYGDTSAYQAWVRRFRKTYPSREFWPAKWFLRPAARQVGSGFPLFEDAFRSMESEWSWHDPLGDSERTVGDGLRISASCGRDLVPPNLSAPRLLRTWPPGVVDGVVEVTCEPARSDRPAIGGLVLWKDASHFLRLEVGRYGKWDIGFGGCLGDRARVIIGRGRLPGAPLRDWSVGEPVTLRLEISGDRVAALCSLDDERWYAVGEVAFPTEGALQVGANAIGLIHFKRAVYHGAYPEGTAIRFTDFRMWNASEVAS